MLHTNAAACISVHVEWLTVQCRHYQEDMYQKQQLSSMHIIVYIIKMYNTSRHSEFMFVRRLVVMYIIIQMWHTKLPEKALHLRIWQHEHFCASQIRSVTMGFARWSLIAHKYDYTYLQCSRMWADTQKHNQHLQNVISSVNEYSQKLIICKLRASATHAVLWIYPISLNAACTLSRNV